MTRFRPAFLLSLFAAIALVFAAWGMLLVRRSRRAGRVRLDVASIWWP